MYIIKDKEMGNYILVKINLGKGLLVNVITEA